MRFQIHTLLLVVTLVAVIMAATPPLYDWLTNPPSIPLSQVVKIFNESKANQTTQIALTETEVIASIKNQLPTLVVGERVKKILRRIVKKRRVPSSTIIRNTITSDPSALNATNKTMTMHFFREPTRIPTTIEILVRR